ncbi:MAG: sulfotransferase [Deltaproteobacteria bacterium]
MDTDALLTKASRRTRLHDFGDPPPEPALAALAQSLDQEANLHTLGRFLIWNHLEELLTTRLRLVEAWKRQAHQLSAARIQRPLFITGMPRSGSTFLHELLGADPDNRVPRVWEVMFPLPAQTDTYDQRKQRIRAAARLWWFRRFAPNADAVHPLRAESPQECMAIHSYTFLSEEFVSTLWIPSYETWLRTADFETAYKWQKKFLQHLQVQESGNARRWVLKSPDHVNCLGALLTVFPNAVIVQTHREPMDVLASCLRRIELLHGLYGHLGRREERVRREARVLADTVDRMLHFRESHPELAGRFIDIKYSDLVGDPLAMVSRIYEHWGVPLTASATEAMRRLVSQWSRYPKPRLVNGQAGLERDIGTEICRFDRYCARFGFPTRPWEISPRLTTNTR